MDPFSPQKKDLTFFGTRIEVMLKESLTQAGIPFHNVEYHPTNDGTTAVELVPFFSCHLKAAEDLIRELFVIDPDRSACLQTREEGGNDLPATYLAYIGPARKELPEWKPFAGEPILLLVSSLFQGALFSVLGFFSGENLSSDPDLDREIRYFSEKAKALDEGLASLYSRHLDLLEVDDDKAESLPDSSFVQKQEPAYSKNSEAETPPEEKPLDMASLRLYLNAGTRMVNMCLSVASESGINVLALEDIADRQTGLARLFQLLLQRKITSYESMERYFSAKLGSWEKIYEALERACADHNFPTHELDLYDLIFYLLGGEKAPFPETPME